MTPEERAELTYTRWISRVGDDVRRALEGTTARLLLIEEIAAVVAEAQETVALGAGTADLPHNRRL